MGDAHSKNQLVGEHVLPTVKHREFVDKIDGENPERLSREFCRGGGTVVDVLADETVVVEVSSGKFSVHRYFVRPESGF